MTHPHPHHESAEHSHTTHGHPAGSTHHHASEHGTAPKPEPMSQAEKLAKTARTNKIRLIVDVFMIVTALLLTFTSIVKLPFPASWFDKLQECGVFNLVSYSLLSYVHDIGGIVFLVSLIIHLILNWKRLQWLIKAALK